MSCHCGANCAADPLSTWLRSTPTPDEEALQFGALFADVKRVDAYGESGRSGAASLAWMRSEWAGTGIWAALFADLKSTCECVEVGREGLSCGPQLRGFTAR